MKRPKLIKMGQRNLPTCLASSYMGVSNKGAPILGFLNRNH